MESGYPIHASLPAPSLPDATIRMFRRALGAVPPACLAGSLLVALGASAAGPAARYPMYRPPERPLLALLPPQGGSLDQAARDTLEKVLAAEAARARPFRLAALPLAVVPDSLVRISPEALRMVREGHGIGFLLRTEVTDVPGGRALLAEIVDTRNGKVRASYRRECPCTPAEVAAYLAPEAVRRLSKSPRLKDFRCGRGMIAIAPKVPQALPASSGMSGAPEAFCIDRYEYPNEPEGEPLTGKTWDEAAALCAREGKRLCTEPEWELACGGWQGRTYPYGETFEEGRCNTGSRIIRLSGSSGGCLSPFGVVDLSGNVYEWTSTPWSAAHVEKVVKGGNWDGGAANSSCKARFGHPPGSPSRAVGFRCCLTMEW